MPIGVYKRTPEMNRRNSERQLGKKRGPHSEETKQKISEALMGRSPSDACIEASAQVKREWTQEMRDLQSARLKGIAGRKGVGRFEMKSGYVLLTGIRDHPLANSDYAIYEHRKVLYDSIGIGPHPCHWCSEILEWGGREGICADHLNEDKSDNREENLVPSCLLCNWHRKGGETDVKQ